MTSDDTEHDFNFRKTPTGGKIHLVSTAESMLARGTENATNYSSACGEVPNYWETNVSPPDDPSDLCQRCAHSLLTPKTDLPDPVDSNFLKRATFQNADGGDDGAT